MLYTQLCGYYNNCLFVKMLEKEVENPMKALHILETDYFSFFHPVPAAVSGHYVPVRRFTAPL